MPETVSLERFGNLNNVVLNVKSIVSAAVRA